MGLSVAGRESSHDDRRRRVADVDAGVKRSRPVIIALFAVIAPALQIGFLLAILLSVRRPPAPRWVGTLLRWTEVSGLWSMIEVMMLGLLVALVKIASLAAVVPGVGIFAVGALIVLLTAMSSGFDPREAWSRVRWVGGEWPERVPSSFGSDAGGGGAMTAVARTGLREGLASCEACGLLSRPAGAGDPGECPRCGAELEFRRPDASRERGRSSSPPRSATCRPTSSR